MYKLIIRDMQEDDIPDILEIEHISFSTPWSRESFLNEIYKKYVFSKAAVFEENVIGYICVNYLLHESHILNLAVHPDFRRRGVATILMNETIKELKKKGCAFMYLEVRISNTGAQKFYERFGFKVETIRKKYYDNPDEDALLMMGRL
ncbi:MAG: ribosomal protein S18-alanine N-acetyltransferase [Nitrospirota bacterium]